MRKTVLTLIVALLGTASSVHAGNDSVGAARAVMDAFMTTFNARDEAGWADTLLFPHVRFASGGVIVYETREDFLREMDLDEFARLNNWDHSRWDAVEVIQADSDKVHFQVTFTRFNPAGEGYVTYDSLYILQKLDGRWGIRARSSFAP